MTAVQYKVKYDLNLEHTYEWYIILQVGERKYFYTSVCQCVFACSDRRLSITVSIGPKSSLIHEYKIKSGWRSILFFSVLMETDTHSQQVQTTLDLLTAYENVDLDKISSLLSDDFQYTLLPKSFDGSTRTKSELLNFLGPLLPAFKTLKVYTISNT